MSNTDHKTLSLVGDEWAQFDQEALNEQEHTYLFDTYFHIFPWEDLPACATELDVRCGSGHWLLSSHPNTSFYIMGTGHRDWFGTQFEKRFTENEITVPMQFSGLENRGFSNRLPFWCALGQKQQASQ